MKSVITIKKIQDLLLQGLHTTYVDDETSKRMWWASLEVVQKEFLSYSSEEEGFWVASPLPALTDKKCLAKLKGWLWSPKGFPYFQHDNAGFLPVDHSRKNKEDNIFNKNYKVLNLNSKDGYEPFLIIITTNFQCLLTIAGEKDKRTLLMRCDRKSLKKAIELIDAKLNQENYEEAINFRNVIKNLGDLNFNNEFESSFWPRLSTKLANLIPKLSVFSSIKYDDKKGQLTEAKLLQAISHEVRTPLATIRTLISSTLRKYNMDGFNETNH